MPKKTTAAAPELTAESIPAPESPHADLKIGVRINEVRTGQDNIRALASVVLNDAFVIKGVRIISGERGLFASMPAQRGQNGKYYEVCHPITKEFATQLSDTVVKEYQRHMIALAQAAQEAQETQETPLPEVELGMQ